MNTSSSQYIFFKGNPSYVDQNAGCGYSSKSELKSSKDGGEEDKDMDLINLESGEIN
jgi:hypothetical protein